MFVCRAAPGDPGPARYVEGLAYPLETADVQLAGRNPQTGARVEKV